jgi:hypothetical protein
VLPVTPLSLDKSGRPGSNGLLRAGDPALFLLSYIRRGASGRSRTRTSAVQRARAVPLTLRRLGFSGAGGIRTLDHPPLYRVLREQLPGTRAGHSPSSCCGPKLVETAGVEPAPPRCKRGALPPELRPRGDADGWTRTTTARGTAFTARRAHQCSASARKGGRPDSNRNLEDHDLGCCRYTTATTRTGTTGFEPAASRLTSERSARLSYAPGAVT